MAMTVRLTKTSGVHCLTQANCFRTQRQFPRDLFVERNFVHKNPTVTPTMHDHPKASHLSPVAPSPPSNIALATGVHTHVTIFKIAFNWVAFSKAATIVRMRKTQVNPKWMLEVMIAALTEN